MRKEIRSFTGKEAVRAGSENQVLGFSYLSHQEQAAVVSAFQYLSPGGSLEITMKQPAGRLVADLQACYGTGFYWSPLERGPLIWRAILSKPPLGVPASITGVMTADHLRLCELWTQFERAVELCQIDRVNLRSAELSLGLRRYIDIEEGILFPVLEGHTITGIAGRTEQMRTEHREIERIVSEFDRLCTTSDYAAILGMFDRPVEPMALFEHHCRREEAFLYPLMDMVFDPAEEGELLSLLQAFEI